MQQDLVWDSRDAEAAFWRQMEHLDQTERRLDAGSGWRSLFDRMPFRKQVLQSRMAEIKASAEELVRLHTRKAPAANETPRRVDPVVTAAEESLRRLANLAVSLRQDRAQSQEAPPSQAQDGT